MERSCSCWDPLPGHLARECGGNDKIPLKHEKRTTVLWDRSFRSAVSNHFFFFHNRTLFFKHMLGETLTHTEQINRTRASLLSSVAWRTVRRAMVCHLSFLSVFLLSVDLLPEVSLKLWNWCNPLFYSQAKRQGRQEKGWCSDQGVTAY